MRFLQNLFSEKSEVSSMRVMAMLSLFIGGVIGCYGVYEGKDLPGLAILCSVFVGAAFTGKVGQKFLENKPSKS